MNIMVTQLTAEQANVNSAGKLPSQSVYNNYDGQLVIEDGKLYLRGKVDRVNKTGDNIYQVVGDVDVEVTPRAVFQIMASRGVYGISHDTENATAKFVAGVAERKLPSGPGAKESAAKLRGVPFKMACIIAEQFGIEAPTEGMLVVEWEERMNKAMAKANGK